MHIKIDTVKIEMTLKEVDSLKSELKGMISELNNLDNELGGYFDEINLSERYPSINNLLSILNIERNDLPF